VTHETSAVFVDVEPRVRLAIEDVLYRFGAGQDLNDRALFQSAFARESELDFVQPAARMGVEIPVFKDGDTIAEQIMAATAELDTTHTVTNSRIMAFDGNSASLFALVEAQHLPRGDHSRHLLLKNFYFLDLVIEGGNWVATRMRIQNVWQTGDPTVLFPGASAR